MHQVVRFQSRYLVPGIPLASRTIHRLSVSWNLHHPQVGATLHMDGNVCGLDEFGEPTVCTLMAFPPGDLRLSLLHEKGNKHVYAMEVRFPSPTPDADAAYQPLPLQLVTVAHDHAPLEAWLLVVKEDKHINGIIELHQASPVMEPRVLDLESMYLNQPVLGAHRISLHLGPGGPGQMAGHLQLDPNRCSLDLWGDPKGCTKMAVRAVDVEAVAMRTWDSHKHGRMHHRLHITGAPEDKVQLIEYAGVGLWYLVHETQEAGTEVVPLFPGAWFGPPTSPALGEPVSLKIGEAAVFAGENLTVEFLAVTEDSRCPTGAVCVWAGEAKVGLRATSGSEAQDFFLTLSVGNAAAACADVFGYRMTLLSLLPHPEVNTQIDPADRVIELRVSK